MNDLEITKACAEAMGHESRENVVVSIPESDTGVYIKGPEYFYDPLHDGAQCFALVKRFRLGIYESDERAVEWDVWGGETERVCGSSLDLNRAICECVYQLHTAKRVP